MTSLPDWLQTNDVTNTEFARRICVSVGTVGRYCRGHRYPDPSTLVKIRVETAGEVTADDMLATWRAARPHRGSQRQSVGETILAPALECRGEWMMTSSGRRFFLLDPRPEDVNFSDIAHALSQLCRYGGHARRFYSVAEHCRLLAEYFEAQGQKENARYALLHDSAEAYLGDMVRPLKERIPAFSTVENRVADVILRAAGLEAEVPKAVLDADTAIISNEANELFSPAALAAADWLPPVEPLAGVNVAGFPPILAERHFRDAFRRLFPELRGR